MKDQTNRMLVMFMIAGFVLLGIGCTTDTSQNNADQNASNVAESSDREMPPPCSSVNETMIKDAVGDFGKYITYDSTEQRLIVEGPIYADIDDFKKFIDILDRFRSEKCVRVVSFQGTSGISEFKWCSSNPCPSSATDPVECALPYLKQGLYQSKLKEQFEADDISFKPKGIFGLVEFNGFVGDKPGKQRFSSLFTQIRELSKVKGCIKQFTLSNSIQTGGKFLRQGFEWQICEYPECEQSGICVKCVIKDTNTNSNTTNSNAP